MKYSAAGPGQVDAGSAADRSTRPRSTPCASRSNAVWSSKLRYHGTITARRKPCSRHSDRSSASSARRSASGTRTPCPVVTAEGGALRNAIVRARLLTRSSASNARRPGRERCAKSSRSVRPAAEAWLRRLGSRGTRPAGSRCSRSRSAPRRARSRARARASTYALEQAVARHTRVDDAHHAPLGHSELELQTSRIALVVGQMPCEGGGLSEREDAELSRCLRRNFGPAQSQLVRRPGAGPVLDGRIDQKSSGS